VTATGYWLLAIGGARRNAAGRSIAALAVCLAAVGSLAAQLLWIEELPSSDKNAAPQYRLVLATACDQTPRPNSQIGRAHV
jgi:hypothetical protein